MAVGPEALTRVAVYRRTVAASEERVFENVRDWEHLPWLHAASFASIEREDSGPWGWRARIGLRGGSEIRLELVIEDGGERYVSRTLAGPGAGSEIWTRVRPRAERETGIEVEFLVPLVEPDRLEPDRAAALGTAYTTLYTRLWDEDEAMMVERQAQLDRPAPASFGAELSLGTPDAVRARVPFVVELGGRSWRIVEHAGALIAHAAVCPHWLGPLDRGPDARGRIRCPWHGYEFETSSRRECGGRGVRLPRPPRVVTEPCGIRLILD